MGARGRVPFVAAQGRDGMRVRGDSGFFCDVKGLRRFVRLGIGEQVLKCDAQNADIL